MEKRPCRMNIRLLSRPRDIPSHVRSRTPAFRSKYHSGMARAGRRLWQIFASVLFTVIIFWAGWMGVVLVWSSIDEARPAGSIVVLGAAQYDGRPSPVLRARLDHGIDLWNQGMGKLLVLTGGKGYGDTTSEAAVGGIYARRHGVPDTSIVLENRGRTTRETMHAV